jgi:hypothetical protein
MKLSSPTTWYPCRLRRLAIPFAADPVTSFGLPRRVSNAAAATPSALPIPSNQSLTAGPSAAGSRSYSGCFLASSAAALWDIPEGSP